MTSERIIFDLFGQERLVQTLCSSLNAIPGKIDTRRFPDGETFLRLDTPVRGREVALVADLSRPDCKFLALAYAAMTARELGASRVGLVAPYLPYMRQDKRFQDGEAITSMQFAHLISGLIDWLVTVDPHLHRRASLAEIYSSPALALHAAPLMSQWIRDNVDNSVLIGPDSESEQWVAEVAGVARAPYLVLDKVRRGERDVSVSLPDPAALGHRTPVLVDDIISTARTMIAAVAHLKALRSAPPVCVGVHAVFCGSAYDELFSAGATRIVTCNSIPHRSNEIDIASVLAVGVKQAVNKGIP